MPTAAERSALARFAGFSDPTGRRELWPFLRRLGFLIALVIALQVAGTIGFVLTEDVSVWRGFVWTLDTIATIGAIPDPENLGGQIVKVLLIMLGVGTLFYALITVAEFFVAGHLSEILDQRRTLRRVTELDGHYIICGFGRVGRQVARDLGAANHPFVVVDELPENRELATELGVQFLLGRPSDDHMLREAGIDRARAVLACVDDDAENIFICLTVRELRSDVTVVARASVADSEKKLLRAGADRVISPYKSSGAEMARLALNPAVAGVVDVAPEYRMEEIEVTAGCEAEGKEVGDISGAATVAALRDPEGKVEPQPAPNRVLHAGDVLVAMGTAEALSRLEELFAPQRGSPPDAGAAELA